MKIYSYSGLLEDGRLWIPIKDSNTLYCFETDYKGSFVGFLDGSTGKKCIEIWWIISYKNFLFLFSRNSYELWRVDKECKDIKYVKYLNEDVNGISNVELYDGIAWVLPDSFNGNIIRVDLESLTAQKKNYLKQGMDCYGPITPTKLRDGKVYFASRTENSICVYSFDCLNNVINSYPINNAKFVNCIDVDEDSIWILYLSKEKKEILLRKSVSSNSIEVFDLSEKIKLSNSIRMDYLRIIRKDNELLFIPFFNESIIRFSLDTMEMIDVTPSDDKDYIVYSNAQVYLDLIILFSPSIGKIKKYNINSKEYGEMNLTMSFEESSRYYKAFISANPIIYEHEGFMLTSYVENI